MIPISSLIRITWHCLLALYQAASEMSDGGVHSPLCV